MSSLPLPNGGALYCLDLAKVHPALCGNKYFKLRHLCALPSERLALYNTLVTAGGPQSHHLDAAWVLANKFGWDCLFVMPEGSAEHPHGFMQTRWLGNRPKIFEIPRHSFSQSAQPILDTLTLAYPEGTALMIPFGGSSIEAVIACEDIASYIPEGATQISLSVGTGCTLAGLVRGLGRQGRSPSVVGLASFSAQNPIEADIQHWLDHQGGKRQDPLPHWEIRYLNEKPFKPFGKPISDALWGQFVSSPLGSVFSQWLAESHHQLPGIDPVYNEKLWYYWGAMYDAGHSLDGLCLINTGGIPKIRY